MRSNAARATPATRSVEEAPRRVWVTGRDDIGEVVDPGTIIGHKHSLYCVGVHFPATGEVVYYEASRVFDVE